MNEGAPELEGSPRANQPAPHITTPLKKTKRAFSANDSLLREKKACCAARAQTVEKSAASLGPG